MTNLSRETRARQVLERLISARGNWVDTAEMSNAAVGGSEGMKRLRELRNDDHWDIRKRRKPNSSQFQYRIVMIDGVPQKWRAGIAQTVERLVESEQVAGSTPAPGTIEPAETYDYSPPGRPGRAHLGKTEDGKYVLVRDDPPAEGQQTAFGEIDEASAKFTSMPGVLELGRTVPCPRCGGYRRAVRERDPITNKQLKHGKIIGYEELSRDPHKPSLNCQRCNGFGVVPNG